MGITPENWKNFFFSESEGLGTLYERLILHKFFEKFIKEYKIKSVIECPSFGMTGFSGINSWYFAKYNITVYICDNDSERLEWIKKLWNMANLNAKFIKIDDYTSLPFKNDEFDLVWNFAALWYLKDCNIEMVLQELARISKKLIFISLPNKNIFYPLRKVFDKEFFEYVDENILEIEDKMIEIFTQKGFKLVDRGYFDVPPWPDFAIKKEELIPFLNKNKSMSGNMEKNNMVLPEYCKYIKSPDIEEKMLKKYSLLENLPNCLKRFWAHHRYWIFCKR